ncbi:MAG: glycosyltransferase [Clostridia bacterium]|nr:glycosyltransferase [Clostridia bacterium]
MPKISVIMGVYNCKSEEMLNKSVNSIIEQTFTDWEFIICNDGSTDDTLTKLQKAAKKDRRIRIISYEQNKGLANALNFCIQHSKGEYIARQDDDDISNPDRFEKQLKVFEEHPEYAIVGSNATVFDDNGDWGKYTTEEKPDKKSFLWNSPFAHPTVIMRAEALKKCGCYRVAKETRRCEDYDLFMRMYANGYIGYNVQEELYRYKVVNDDKKYRPMKYRIDEAVVRRKGYKQLKMGPKGIIYILKPIIIGLIPQFIFKRIRSKQY